MKKNSGASDLFIRQSNWVLTALKAPIGPNAEEPGPGDELLAGHGHPRFFVRDERMPLTGPALRRAKESANTAGPATGPWRSAEEASCGGVGGLPQGVLPSVQVQVVRLALVEVAPKKALPEAGHANNGFPGPAALRPQTCYPPTSIPSSVFS